MAKSLDHVPPLRFHIVTRFYDAIVQLLMQEEQLRLKSSALIKADFSGKILELGCGTGSLTQVMAKNFPKSQITATDIDLPTLRIADKKCHDLHNVSLAERNAVASVRSGELYDIVITSLMFHHLTGDQKKSCLRHITGSLKPTGKLLLIDFGVPASLWERLGFWLVRCLDGLHVTSANYYGELPQLIKNSGLSLETSQPMHHSILGTVWAFIAYKSKEK